jgi:alpha-tubulin suppressor-like RCC1 family protein
VNPLIFIADGRVFSSGGYTECLGREWKKEGEYLDELKFDEDGSTKIVQIATGKEHVIALNDKGEVFTWGRSDAG